MGAESLAGPESALIMGECSGAQRWQEHPSRGQVQHVLSMLCLDAGDRAVPILYACHEPKAQSRQHFSVSNRPGRVLLHGGWEDHGRKRLFEKCLDRVPATPIELSVENCDMAAELGVAWAKTNVLLPLEAEIWRRTR